MLHTLPSAGVLRHDALAREWADAEIVRMRAHAAAKLRAAASRDWQIYSRLANIPRPAPRTPPRELIERVAAWHQISAGLILSDVRHRLVIEARFDAVAAVKLAHPRISLTRLGEIFDRDHSSVLSALRKRGVSCSR